MSSRKQRGYGTVLLAKLNIIFYSANKYEDKCERKLPFLLWCSNIISKIILRKRLTLQRDIYFRNRVFNMVYPNFVIFQLPFFHGAICIFPNCHLHSCWVDCPTIFRWERERKIVMLRLTLPLEQWIWSDGEALRASSTATPSLQPHTIGVKPAHDEKR